jgi:hypothetical protein
MGTLRQFRNFWLPSAATIVLVCSSNAFAQQSYKITDLGLNHSTTTSAWSWDSIIRAGQRTWMDL